MIEELPSIIEQRRVAAPCVTPQALAFQGEELWLSSRDLGLLYRVEVESWEVVETIKPPGVIWAAVSLGEELRCTIGEGAEDDRYVYSYSRRAGFEKLFACPEFAGSYLSFDGDHLYLSQWYKKRILRMDAAGKVLDEIGVGAEICGHAFVHGDLYVVRGAEKPDEAWRIARVDLHAETPPVTDLATVPFACRSLTSDGEKFWSNHRAANETISFTVPSP